MKRIVSIVLTLALLASFVPVYAENDVQIATTEDVSVELPWEQEEVGTGDVTTPISIGEVDSVEEEENEIPEYEPIIHEETISDDIEFPEVEQEEESEDEGLFSRLLKAPLKAASSSASPKEIWKSILNEQFGADYLQPFKQTADGQRVTGNTNRLVIEETDLSLPGKNGLDVVLKRQYDNQDYDEAYGFSKQFNSNGKLQAQKSKQYRYIYKFKNSSDNSALYIAFLSEDQLYMYLYGGFNMKTLNTKYIKTYTSEGTTIKYYNFDYVAGYLTTDTSYDHYEYDSTFSRIRVTQTYDEGATVALEDRDILRESNSLGADWKLLLPGAYLYCYEDDIDTEDYPKYYRKDYVGTMRDIHGKIYTFEGYDTFKKYKDGRTTYGYSYSPEDNKYLRFESLWEPVQLYENGPYYNFVVYDSTGLTYYFNDIGLTNGSNPKYAHRIYILAVKDDYGNMIKYQYDGDTYQGSVSKIIDTYGREINISSVTGGKQISYYDDVAGKTKTITYTTETKTNNEYSDDDSILKPKNITRFTVTNEAGESTIYDSREAEVLNYYYSSSSGDMHEIPDVDEEQVKLSYGHNIERIVYPSGAETRYRYKCVYPINANTRIRRGVYAVDASYDLVDNVKENKKEYSFTNTGMAITSTCVENDADRKTVSAYNKDGLATTITTTPQETTAPFRKITYSYNSDNYPTSIATNENGTTSTSTFSYVSGYPNVLSSESNGLRTVSYNYHSVDNKLTDKISRITYKPKTGTSSADYYMSTELTADNKSIEYEKIVQNDIIKAQKKYEYDAFGEVVGVKQWTNDTNNDGVLDESDNVIDMGSDYVITANKNKIVTTSVENVLNADGINEGTVDVDYEYNIYGYPVSQTDSYAFETTIEYDDINRPVQYNFPNGGTRTVDYNVAQNYTIVTDEAGITYKYVYDGMGRIKQKLKKDGNSYNLLEEYEYDNMGRLEEKKTYRTETEGISESYSYDVLDRVTQKDIWTLSMDTVHWEVYVYNNSANESTVTKKTYAVGAAIADQKDYYNIYGQLTKSEKTAGDTTLATQYEYDYFDRVTKETDPKGNETTYEYAYDGQITKQTNPAGDYVSTVYDLAGQPVSVTDANGNTTNTEYDKLGRAIKVTTPFDDTVSGETKTYYDKNSNVVKTAVKRSANIYQIKEFKYDNMGNLLADISKNGSNDVITQYQYDSGNRIVKMITGLEQYSTNPTGGAATTYTYNNQGYLASVIDPMGGIVTYNSYDLAGNMLSMTDKNSNVNKNEYGPYGLTKSYFEGSPETKEYTYNRLGQLKKTKAVNANGQAVEESYKYDYFGRKIQVTSNDGSVQNYSYDNNSNLTAYNLEKDETTENEISYTYNNLNQLTGLTNNGIITSYSYDANGNLVQKAQNNGVNTNYTYNKANLMTHMQSKKGSNVYTYSSCSYLLNGLIGRISMPYDGFNNNEEKTKVYNYSLSGQLTGEGVVNAAGQPFFFTYKYDLNGNRTEKTGVYPDNSIDETTTYQYDKLNHLISENSNSENEYTGAVSHYTNQYYYDNNGNMIAKQKTTYGSANDNSAIISGRSNDTGLSIYRYDAFNRLTSYNSGSAEATYMYDADNLRASKTVNRAKTDFVWNGQNLAAEHKSDATNTYAYDMTGVHIANQDGVVTSYLKDFHGNIVGKTTAAGAMVQDLNNRMDYDAFGNQWIGETPDPFGYCSEYYDNESGLIYLRNRYYDSTSGRFITEDPIRDGLNWYVYCGNNPVIFVDSSGLAFTLPNYNANGDARLQALQALTDDTLDYDINTGLVNITNQVSTPTRDSGTNLVRELIANPILCTIDYTPDNNSYTIPTYDANGNLIAAEIQYNPNLNFQVLVKTDSGNQWVPETNYIVMGHEMVHFYNRLQGNTDNIPDPNGNYTDPSNGNTYKGGTYYVQDSNGVWQTNVDKIEELRTTGITSYRFWYDSKGVQNVYSVHPGQYSENSLRQENQMPKRVQY